MAYASIDNLVDEGSGIIILGGEMIEVSEISTNSYGSLFLGDEHRIGNP